MRVDESALDDVVARRLARILHRVGGEDPVADPPLDLRTVRDPRALHVPARHAAILAARAPAVTRFMRDPAAQDEDRRHPRPVDRRPGGDGPPRGRRHGLRARELLARHRGGAAAPRRRRARRRRALRPPARPAVRPPGPEAAALEHHRGALRGGRRQHHVRRAAARRRRDRGLRGLRAAVHAPVGDRDRRRRAAHDGGPRRGARGARARALARPAVAAQGRQRDLRAARAARHHREGPRRPRARGAGRSRLRGALLRPLGGGHRAPARQDGGARLHGPGDREDREGRGLRGPRRDHAGGRRRDGRPRRLRRRGRASRACR